MSASILLYEVRTRFYRYAEKRVRGLNTVFRMHSRAYLTVILLSHSTLLEGTGDTCNTRHVGEAGGNVLGWTRSDWPMGFARRCRPERLNGQIPLYTAWLSLGDNSNTEHFLLEFLPGSNTLEVCSRPKRRTGRWPEVGTNSRVIDISFKALG